MVSCVQGCLEFPRAIGSAPVAWGDAQRQIAARGSCARIISNARIDNRIVLQTVFCNIVYHNLSHPAALDRACLVVRDREFNWAVVMLKTVCQPRDSICSMQEPKFRLSKANIRWLAVYRTDTLSAGTSMISSHKAYYRAAHWCLAVPYGKQGRSVRTEGGAMRCRQVGMHARHARGAGNSGIEI